MGLLLALSACGEDAPEADAVATAASNVGADRMIDGIADAEPQPVPAQIDLARPATAAVSTGRTTCHGITGFLFDADPAGRIVRNGPSVAARELGRIPPPQHSDDWGGEWPYQFDVIGSQDGWLQIANASFDESMGGKPSRRAFSGTGWIAAGGVHVGVQSRTGFAEPSHNAPVLLSGYPDVDLDGFGPQRVIACQGRWILADWPAQLTSDGGRETWHLRYRPEAVVRRDPVLLRAWVAGVCNIVETTCDGISGDFPATSRLDSDD